jgi:hypothetical protein
MPENLQIRRDPDIENGFIYRKDWPPTQLYIGTVDHPCTCFAGLAYLKPDLCGVQLRKLISHQGYFRCLIPR